MGFTRESFGVFDIEGLEPRMAVIREKIQPIFRRLWEENVDLVAGEIDEAMYIHIAQHIRRTTHAPESTWSAISISKRGYKKEPHFQIGIWADYVFVYLSMIDNPEHEKQLAERLLKQKGFLKKLPKDFVYSTDHTKPEVYKITKDIEKDIIRFRDVKKAEFEIGRIFKKSDEALWENPQQIEESIKETIDLLLPLYKKLRK